VVQGRGLRAVGEVLSAEVVGSLRVGHHQQVLDVPIKVILVINFLSEKNNAVRFQSNFVSLDFLSILIITVQNSSSRVAFNTDSQSMPLSGFQLETESHSVPAPIAAALVHENDAAAEADREDEAPVSAVRGEQLALVAGLEGGQDGEVIREPIWECSSGWYRYHSLSGQFKGNISLWLALPGLAVAGGGVHGGIGAEPELVQEVHRPGGRGCCCSRGLAPC